MPGERSARLQVATKYGAEESSCLTRTNDPLGWADVILLGVGQTPNC